MTSTSIAESTSLAEAAVATGCRACVVVPARNEAEGLAATLDALRLQVGLNGEPLPQSSFEVLLLLNNCTDASAQVARRYQDRYRKFALHVSERTLAAELAHVGTARRMLMDAACERMEPIDGVILSTDADTLVAGDWVATNLAEIERGAEVVGGMIYLLPEELAAMDAGTRRAYERDRRYQELVAELESLLDPNDADPWPRHMQHFGASLACTCEVYRRSGGLPAVKPLEDVAFVDALRRVDARIRHSPAVQINTSARMNGRVDVGLSGQLRHWAREAEQGIPHLVESAEWLCHRFASMGELRRLHAGGCCAGWPERVGVTAQEGVSVARFLELIDCDRLIEERFCGERYGEVGAVTAGLASAVDDLRR